MPASHAALGSSVGHVFGAKRFDHDIEPLSHQPGLLDENSRVDPLMSYLGPHIADLLLNFPRDPLSFEAGLDEIVKEGHRYARLEPLPGLLEAPLC